MSAKSAKLRRKETRRVISEQAAAGNGLAERCEKLERICRQLKAREGYVTVALVALSVAYKKKDSLSINKFIGDMLRGYDLLATCCQVMGQRDLAMKIALTAIEKAAEEYGDAHDGVFVKALEQVNSLDPFFIYAHASEVPEPNPEPISETPADEKLEDVKAAGSA